MKATKMVRVGLASALVGALVIGAGSAASAAPSNSTVNLAGVLYGINDPFFKTIQCAADVQAKKMGATIKWKNITDYDAKNVVQAINTAMLSKPKGLIVSIDDRFLAPLASVQKKGTIVSGVNWKGAPATYYQTVISSPANDALDAVADMIIKDVGKTGSVAIFGGQAANAGMEARWKPIVAAVNAKAPGIKFLETQYTNYDVNKSATITQSLITANPDLKAIYTTNGPEGQGALAGVQQSKAKGIGLYSFDAVPAMVAGLKAGTVSGLIAQPAGAFGTQAVQTAVNWIRLHPGNTKPVPVNSLSELQMAPVLLTQANINTALGKTYAYKSSCK